MGRLAVAVLVVVSLGAIAPGADIKESKDYLFGRRDQTFFDGLTELGISKASSLPPNSGTVVVMGTQLGSTLTVKAIASKDTEGPELAGVLVRAMSTGGQDLGSVEWSVEDEGTIAQFRASSAKWFRNQAETSVQIGRLREEFSRAGFELLGAWRTTRHGSFDSTVQPDKETKNYNYLSLEGDLPSDATVTVRAEVKTKHLLILFGFALFPFVGCMAGLILATRYAKQSSDSLKQKRAKYSKLVLYPTMGSIGLHFPFFIFVVLGGSLRPLSDVWLGSASLSQVFMPFMLVSLLPILVAFRFASKAEKDLFAKPAIEESLPSSEPSRSTAEKAIAEAINPPKWVTRAQFGAFGLMIIFFASQAITGTKNSPVSSYFPLILALVFVTIAIGPLSLFLRNRGRRVETHDPERARALFAEIGGNPQKLRIDSSPLGALAIQGIVTPVGTVRVSSKAVTDLTDGELKVLLAHELAHIKYKHPGRSLVIMLAFYIPILGLFVFRGRLSAVFDSTIVFMAPFILVILFAFAFLAFRLRTLRRIEQDCDLFALTLTRDPESMLGLWKKMWEQSPGVTALSDTLSTHPSLLNRFKKLGENSKSLGLSSPQLEAEIDRIVALAESD